jgi:enoyl-CoA hydratase/carnithine racemase
MQKYLLYDLGKIPAEDGWLYSQPCPVIACGEGWSANADTIVPDRAAAEILIRRIETNPVAALMLVQTVRCTEHLETDLALDVESMAYATLQAGAEFRHWQTVGQPTPPPATTQEGEAILLSRNGPLVNARLNRENTRNAMSVEMRDAWVEALELLALDDTISTMRFSGNGACFSTGGDLSEFGTFPDPATAHHIRSVFSPARLLHSVGARTCFYLHGACLGSGIELPAFGHRVIAHRRAFFQLPEIQLGLIPGAGGTTSITRRIGRQRLVWMALSGKRINALQALEWGLIDEIADLNPFAPST